MARSRRLDLAPGDPYARCFGFKPPGYFRREDEGPGIACRDIEDARRSGRFECRALLQSGAQPVQRVAHGRHQRVGHGRGLHAAALAYEQRVFEMHSQPRKGIADRWLCDVQGLAGAGQAALDIDRLQDGQEIEVDRAQVHGGSRNYH